LGVFFFLFTPSPPASVAALTLSYLLDRFPASRSSIASGHGEEDADSGEESYVAFEVH